MLGLETRDDSKGAKGRHAINRRVRFSLLLQEDVISATISVHCRILLVASLVTDAFTGDTTDDMVLLGIAYTGLYRHKSSTGRSKPPAIGLYCRCSVLTFRCPFREAVGELDHLKYIELASFHELPAHCQYPIV